MKEGEERRRGEEERRGGGGPSWTRTIYCFVLDAPYNDFESGFQSGRHRKGLRGFDKTREKPSHTSGKHLCIAMNNLNTFSLL